MNQELAALVQRLESVAVRLEGVHGTSDQKVIVSELVSLVKQATSSNASAAVIAKSVDKLEGLADKKQAGGNDGESSASVQAFDAIIAGSFQTYLNLSKKIGDDVAKHSLMVEAAFKAQRAYLVVAAKSKKPDDSVLPELLKPTSDKICEIQDFREKNRRSSQFNHLSSISESIPALGWVTVSPAPSPFIKEMMDAGQFYTNRVLKDWKDKSKSHVEWTKAWLATLQEMMAFVKDQHTTGLVWNPKGGDAKANATTSNGAAAPPPPPPAGGPPPPPPPPPADLFADIVATNPEDTARNKLFDELNKGSDITKGLKKVTADMQTHKNPELRGQGAPEPKAKSPPKPAAKPAAAPTRPPRFELDGKKWMVEYHIKPANPFTISETETNQSVYIYRCEGTTVVVKGKVNNVIMDSCKKCAVVFDNVVSACEFINCQSAQMQTMGAVPTISVEKTDGCQMYLSKEAAESTEIITAKSSEMNVLVPNPQDDGDFMEMPIPEQFKTVIKGAKLVTSCTESV